jgi:hypothetical protein
MSKGRELRCYDYVNFPYERVRDAIQKDALAVFQAATKGATSRAKSIASELRVNIGGLEIAKEIAIAVNGIEEDKSASSPKTVLRIEWEAAESPGLFPLMNAELSIYPLTATETQLDFAGLYEPPAGALGGVIDSIVGKRIADVTVHRFVTDVATYLRSSLAKTPAG